MRVALDASYSVDSHPTGIGIYSRELMAGLPEIYPQDEFLYCYRPKQFRNSTRLSLTNVGRRLLLPNVPTFRADLFHALNQRVDRRPARMVLATFHDLFVMTGEYSSPDFRARFTEQARRAAALSDLVIAVSEFTAHQVQSLLAVERTRIRVIPHGVRQAVRKEPVTRERMILFVGALQIRKNVGRLVEAFEATPPDWTLVIAGSPGGYRAQEILDSIGGSRCKGRIQVLGYVSGYELSQLYSRASIFAFPSLAEGFGIPVLEAMSYGVPVVTSNTSALAEVAGDAALLVDPEETDQIATALLRLIHEPALWKTLAARGVDHAATYSWERAIHSTHQVYGEVSVGRGAAV